MKLSADQRVYLAQGGEYQSTPGFEQRIGIRKVLRVWFNRSSGHYVADCGSCFMWTDDGVNWKTVPGSAPCERARCPL